METMTAKKDFKTTVCEERRNPDPSTRVKKRSELMLIQMNLEKRTFQVIQHKTVHLSKMGYHVGPNHFMMLEEVIYLMELGSAAVVTQPKSDAFLSLNQLFALLPVFGVSFFQYSAYRSLVKANYRVKKPSAEQQKLFQYNVYLSVLNGVQFSSLIESEFLKFHLFATSPNQNPSNELIEFASKSDVPVFVTSGQSSCVRFSPLLAPIKMDFSVLELHSALDDEDDDENSDSGDNDK